MRNLHLDTLLQIVARGGAGLCSRVQVYWDGFIAHGASSHRVSCVSLAMIRGWAVLQKAGGGLNLRCLYELVSQLCVIRMLTCLLNPMTLLSVRVFNFEGFDLLSGAHGKFLALTDSGS